MINVVMSDSSMPLYLDEPPAAKGAERAEPAAPPVSHAPQTRPDVIGDGRASTYSSWFFRLVPLPASRLPSLLETWWLGNGGGTIVTVDHRLELGPPRLERGVWTMSGGLHRRGRHPVPLTLDLWPHNDEWSSLVLRPQARVATTSRYFRIGHRVLDCFLAELLP